MKPTDVETLWVHVTCAWFQPEVCFASDEKMEPALGILSIPSSNFVKVHTFVAFIWLAQLVPILLGTFTMCKLKCKKLSPVFFMIQICVICKQIHGSCTQCCKCSTYYHAMCASRAGYRMEVSHFTSDLSLFHKKLLIWSDSEFEHYGIKLL